MEYQGIALVVVLWVAVSQHQLVAGVPVRCGHHFGREVKRCLDPYWSSAVLLQPRRPRPGANDVLAKHLCLQFEMALACLHTALRQCPSHANVEYVQSKLGSDWAMDIRDLCVGQSGLATNHVPEEELTDIGDLFESSNEFLQDYLTDLGGDDEEEEEENVIVAEDSKQIVVVLRGARDDVYSFGGARRKLKLRARHSHHDSSPMDVKIFNIFDNHSHSDSSSAGTVVHVTMFWWICLVCCAFVVLRGLF